MVRRLRGALLAGLAGALACGSQLRSPPRDAHVGVLPPIYVDYPPPPAVAESIPRDPGGACVWLDGHWDWLGRRWEWAPGGWVTPPEGCFYAAPFINWEPTAGASRLTYTPAHWYPRERAGMSEEQVRTACRKPVPCGPPAKPYRAPVGGNGLSDAER